jgi:hypothetical protein
VLEAYHEHYDNDPYDFYMSKYQASRSLDAYIIQFMTFVEMRKRFPDQILMVPFDDIQRCPEEKLQEIVEFIGIPLDQDKRTQYIAQACHITSKENMKKFEEQLGYSLSARRSEVTDETPDNMIAQVRKNHITITKRPKWQDAFTRDDMRYVKERLEAFGIMPEDISPDFRDNMQAHIQGNIPGYCIEKAAQGAV